jgi:chemotaxis protein CheX
MQQTNAQLIGEVCELLNSGIGEVFNTMFNLSAEPVAPPDLSLTEEPLIAGSVGFVGDANGMVYVHLTNSFARQLAAVMLQMEEAELEDYMVNDVVAEISNMIVGSVKSNLCDRGYPCVLTIPSIVRGREFYAEAPAGSERALLGYQCGVGQLFVEVIARPPQ